MVVCAGCQLPIYDRYLFHVNEAAWHSSCVTCADCSRPLTDRCFVRNGLLFCREDFFRRYGTKCAGCDRSIVKGDMIRRARDKVFHLQCFTCSICHKELKTGDELYILDGSKYVCKFDYHACKTLSASSGASECGDSDDLEDEENDECEKSETELSLTLTELSPCCAEGEPGNAKGSTGITDPKAVKTSAPRNNQQTTQSGDENSNETASVGGTKRRGPRTTIKAKQLETLKAAFNATPKPTRHIREQLAQDTGLNMRVIQVWFQNRRSKERRMKHLRFGNYRPGRRNRGGRDEVLLGSHMFPDALSAGEAYYQQTAIGHDPYYMMVPGDHHPGNALTDMGIVPGHIFPSIMSSDDLMSDAQPAERRFMLEDQRLRTVEGAFQAAFLPGSKHEEMMPARHW